MVKLVSTTQTNSVEVSSAAEAQTISNMLGKYGIKVGVQAVQTPTK